MKHLFLLRLALDLIAAGLLLVGLAYWWLDNAAHELVGTGMFLLIIIHNVFNRRWYGTIPKSRHGAPRRINLSIILCLLIAMVVLLVTSMMISRDVLGFLPLDDSFTAREIHMLAAYWALLIVSLHLGTRWSVIMAALAGAFGITGKNALRTAVLRIVAATIALYGLQSSFEMAFGSKLILQYTLDMWDFNESTAGFFLNYMSIIGLYAAMAYYTMKLIRDGR